MTFDRLAKIFEDIRTTSSRTDITHKLADAFREATAHEARYLAYFSLGILRPPYQGTQFNIAEKSMQAIVADICDEPSSGDLSHLVRQCTWQGDQEISVGQVYDRLSDLEMITGTGSVERRAEAIKILLREVTPRSAAIIVGIITGKLRLGFSEMTIIDALSWMLVGDKSLRSKLEHAYNICADSGHIAYSVKKHGIDALNHSAITIGIPVRPAAAERLPTAHDIIEKIGHAIAQPKIDGFRLQIHSDSRAGTQRLWFFSRNLHDMSTIFPDIAAALKELPKGSIIMEGEAIGYDEQRKKFVRFQETVQRKRKHGVEQAALTLPLHLFLFDILYYNGESLLDKEYHDRRRILASVVEKINSPRITLIEERPVQSAEQLEAYFKEAVAEGLEGLMVKRPYAHYQPGKRNFNWIKLKYHAQQEIEDTIDVVILGYYHGKGKRARFGIGAFLVGIYHAEQDRFETIAKIGTGMSDAEWVALKERCDLIRIDERPRDLSCASELFPDVWVQPTIVCSVRADEITRSPAHTAGYALRFPRFISYRDDKSAYEITTRSEIIKLFENRS